MKRMSGCGSGTEYLSVTPWGDLYPCHQFVGQEEFLMGNVDDGIVKPEIADDFRSCSVYSKEKCKNCFATVAVDVWQTLIISMELSMIVMMLAVRCSVNVWNVPL